MPHKTIVIMPEEIKEKYINPYTDFGFKKLFEQAEIAKYSETERRQYEASQKDYWDYTSTLETAELKGVQREKIETIHRLQAIGLPIEQIAQGVGMDSEEVKKFLK